MMNAQLFLMASLAWLQNTSWKFKFSLQVIQLHKLNSRGTINLYVSLITWELAAEFDTIMGAYIQLIYPIGRSPYLFAKGIQCRHQSLGSTLNIINCVYNLNLKKKDNKKKCHVEISQAPCNSSANYYFFILVMQNIIWLYIERRIFRLSIYVSVTKTTVRGSRG